jgi:hypothetical protein
MKYDRSDREALSTYRTRSTRLHDLIPGGGFVLKAFHRVQMDSPPEALDDHVGDSARAQEPRDMTEIGRVAVVRFWAR